MKSISSGGDLSCYPNGLAIRSAIADLAPLLFTPHRGHRICRIGGGGDCSIRVPPLDTAKAGKHQAGCHRCEDVALTTRTERYGARRSGARTPV